MKVMVTGHRPPKIGGYNRKAPQRLRIKAAIAQLLDRLKPDEAITGMALGADQDFADVCVAMNIPFCAAVPFSGQELRWPKEAQAYYQSLLTKASRVVNVSPSNAAATIAMHQRNEWMVDEIGDDGQVIAIFNGSAGGTAHTVQYAISRRRTIHVVDPELFTDEHVGLDLQQAAEYLRWVNAFKVDE